MNRPGLAIPAGLEPAMRQFARDFDAMARHWVEREEETVASMADARAGLRAYLADTADPDAYGVARADRLRHVFGFWRELALRHATHNRAPAAVQPVLPVEVERRLLDKARARNLLPTR